MANILDLDTLHTGSDNEAANVQTMANIPDLDALHTGCDNEAANIQTVANIPDLDTLHTGSDNEAANVQTVANIPDLDTLHTGSDNEAASVQTMANIPNLDTLHTDSDNEAASFQTVANIPDLGSLHIGSDNEEAEGAIIPDLRSIGTNSDTETNNIAIANITDTVSEASSANTQLDLPILEDTPSPGNEDAQTANGGQPWPYENIRVEERPKLYKRLRIVQERPKMPEYATECSRKLSFSSWNGAVQAECLAKGGFYFEGNGDQVKCFYCGNTLQNWRRGDNAWIEHARWFPECPYLVFKLDQCIIHAVQGLQQDQKDDQHQISIEEVIQRMQQNLSPAEYEKAKRRLLDNLNESYEEDIDLESEDPKQLKEENQRLKNKTACVMCKRANRRSMVLPCGHVVLCQICAWKIDVCVVCREPIVARVEVFLL